MKPTDTDRLEFLMRFFRVFDTGDESVCPGMLVDVDAVSDAFDFGPLADEKVSLMDEWVNPDMRRAIDKAMAFAAAETRTCPHCGVTWQPEPGAGSSTLCIECWNIAIGCTPRPTQRLERAEAKAESEREGR